MKSNLAPILLLVGAIIFGGGAAILANQYITSSITKATKEAQDRIKAEYAGIRIVVATANLPAGVILSTDYLGGREIPSGFLPLDVVTEGDFENLIGAKLLSPVKAGAPLAYSQVSQGKAEDGFSNLVETGKRALTFPVDQVSSISGLLLPRDRIDLILTTQDGNETTTQTLLENVTVIAADQNTGDNLSTGQSIQTVTIMVTPENASRIITAREIGTLTAILRGPKDFALNDEWASSKFTKRTLLGKKAVTKKEKDFSVPVIRGGK